MFKVFVLGLLTLLGAVYVTIMAKEDPGYALLSYGDWSVEMTIVLLVVALGSLIILAIIAVYLLLKLMDIPDKLLNWNRERKSNSAISHSIQGFIQVIEGNWKSAEKHLNKNIKNNKMALPNYLAAAKVAQRQGQSSRRDDYLMQAFQRFPNAEMAIGLTQAELEIDAKEYQQAKVTLLHLRTLASGHKQVLQLLLRVYKHLSSWQDLALLLKDIKTYDALEGRELKALEKQVYQHTLSDLALKGNSKAMMEQWHNADKYLRADSDMCCFYSQLLISIGVHDKASELLKVLLKKEWNVEAINIYGDLVEENGTKQLEYAEKFLQNHPADATLLFTLGKISLANQLWGKARDYIQESVLISPDSDKLYELGNLYETRLDDSAKALQCYREGLLFAKPVNRKELIADKPSGETTSIEQMP